MQKILFLMMEMFSLVLNCHLSYQLVKMRCACFYHDPAINHVVWIPSLHSLSSCVWMNFKINNLYEEFQSSYRKFHSTETALTSVHDDMLRHIDEKQCVILLLLDLSAAFDTINHNILLYRLQSHLGVCDVALQWFR